MDWTKSWIIKTPFIWIWNKHLRKELFCCGFPQRNTNVKLCPLKREGRGLANFKVDNAAQKVFFYIFPFCWLWLWMSILDAQTGNQDFFNVLAEAKISSRAHEWDNVTISSVCKKKLNSIIYSAPRPIPPK